VDDGSGMPNATAITSKTVRINMPPLANAGPDKRVCAGDVVIFDGGASTDPEGGLLRYFWDFGDSTFAEGVNPTTLYKKGGVYRVTLRVEDDSSLPTCNSSTDQIVVWVSQSPISDAGPDQTVCAGVPVQFDGSKSWDIDGLVNNYLWDFGDGQTGGGPTPTHIFTAPGAYRVTLTITGDKTGDCDNTNSDDMIVTVYEAPLATFKAPSRAALPLPVSFDASESRPGGGKIVQYAWDFGDSTTGEGAVVQHRYARAGRYYAQLTVTNDSETDCNQTTVRSLIVVNDAPVPNGGPDRLAGVDEELLFDASKSSDADGVITRCDWDFADGTTATGVQVRKAFRKSGVYPVRLFTTDDAGLENSRSVDTIFVDVNAPPQPVVEVNVNACAGREARISAARSSDADGAIKSYHWDFGDGSTGEGVETTHTWFLPGKYILLLTLDDGRGALNSRVQLPTTIIANLPPVAEAGLDRIVSPNEPSQFDAAGSYDPDGKITGYHWDFGDGATATGAKVSHSYAAPGTFRATLTVTDNSGSDCPTGSETVIVRANAAPIPDAGGDREGFAGGAHDAILFDASASRDPDGDPLQFAWEFGDGSTGKGAKAAHVFAKPGTYRVKLKLDDGTGTKAGLATQEITVIIRAHGR